MSKKSKAKKLINAALGLIVIFAVILCSPLFGYGRGLAPEERRRKAAEAPAGFSTGYTAAPAAAVSATPRPTAQPTPAPVVLPSAPPAPDPTPEPVRQPAPAAAVQQPVRQEAQPAQQNWAPEEGGEEYEESGDETPEDGEEMPGNTIGIGEEVTATEDGSQYIATEEADIVIGVGPIDNGGSGGGEVSFQESYTPQQEFVPDASEAEAFTIG